MPCCGSHFANTWGQWICTSPRRFNIFTSRFPGSFHVTQIEIISTLCTMAVDVPTWDCHVGLSCVRDLHWFWELRHALSEVFRPLAYDIVRRDKQGSGQT